MEKEKFSELLEKAKQIAEQLIEKEKIVLCHHIDADGISSGAIIAKTLNNLGKDYETISLKQLYKEDVDRIKKLGENYFFADFGSGQAHELEKAFGKNCCIIDHHQPQESNLEFHLNAMLFGFDGSKQISGSATAFLVSQSISKKNSELSRLALIGMIGDMQDSFGEFESINAKIIREGIEKGFIEKTRDLRMYGRISRPLTQFLLFATEPILPTLTANEQNCVSFYKKLGIELKNENGWKSYEDLSKEEKKLIVNELIMLLAEKNVPEWKIKELIGNVYFLSGEEKKSIFREAKEAATLLNSCGRRGASEIGLKVCLGDRKEYYTKALHLLNEHRKQLAEGIRFIQEKGIEERKNYYFFDAEEKIGETIVGIIAGMLYGSGLISQHKPIIAFARNNDETIKVSARATRELTRNGINLGLLMREICEELGENAQGGGHKIAAGAKINSEQKESFLELLEKKLEG